MEFLYAAIEDGYLEIYYGLDRESREIEDLLGRTALEDPFCPWVLPDLSDELQDKVWGLLLECHQRWRQAHTR